jgi:hypothetical protein
MQVYTVVSMEITSITQHLKQQGTIILPVFNLNHEANVPQIASLMKSCPKKSAKRQLIDPTKAYTKGEPQRRKPYQ